jgi:ADP-ribose pyrophosphatase YjhB (NUDIX family)
MLRLTYLIYEIYSFIFKPVLFGVRVMLVKDNQVLLVKHTYKKGWYLPGGGVKRGETVEEAARREAHEETGAELRNIRLVGIFTNFEEGVSGHNIVFLSNDFNIVGRPDHEIAEARFFSLDALPADLLPGHRQRLEEYRDEKQLNQFGEW